MTSISESGNPKRELATIARAASGGVIGIRQSARALGVSQRQASARLSAWTRAGWLARIRRGVYLIVPLEAESQRQTTAEDPWLLAAALFPPCYIGGWSAAEHWGLTEQIFRSTFVATAANIRSRNAQHVGATFTLARVKSDRLRRLETVWRGRTRVSLSGPERTIVDAAIEPRWVGGFRHLADVFRAYTRERNANPNALLNELLEFGNGAAAKRVGFLTERLWPRATDLIEGARALRSSGVVKLDPAIARRGQKNSRWGVWLNVSLNDLEERSDA